MFSFSSPCRVCQGRGVVIEQACPTCRGPGIERRPREVQARIPAGVADGQTIRLKGRGSPGRNGGPAGDLLVEIKVTPHRQFGRSGNDLTVKVPITFAEAALGGDIDVPTLDGQRSRCGSNRGRRAALGIASRARASSRPRRAATTTGDLIVTVDVNVPTHTDRRRARGCREAGRRDHRESKEQTCDGQSRQASQPTHRTRAVYVISVAAELAGMHPQTLRIYERRGLVLPGSHTRRQPALQR